MEAVTGDPSLDSVSHEFEIENGLRVFLVLNELSNARFGQLRGRGHSMVLFAGKTLLGLSGRV